MTFEEEMMDSIRETTVLALVIVATVGCGDSGICYGSSSADVDELVTSGRCEDIRVRDVDEAVMRFTNDEPSISVYIDIDYNPGVRRVEADGRGRVVTSRIDEVIRTRTNCLGAAGGARVLELTIGRNDGQRGFCNFAAEPGAIVRLFAESDVIVDHIDASSRDWSTVSLDVDESARPTGTLYAGNPPLQVLQKFGTQMNDVQLNRPSDDELDAYFAWLDTEGYDGTVHVNSGDSQQTPVQVYPPTSD